MITLGLELSNRPLSNYFGGKCFMSNAAFRSNKHISGLVHLITITYIRG